MPDLLPLGHLSSSGDSQLSPRPTAICAPSPPGGPASGAHRSECGGRSDGRRSTCPRALGRGGLWRARERWRRWPRPAGRTPRSACRAPPPFGPVRPVRKEVGGSFRIYQRKRSPTSFSSRHRVGTAGGVPPRLNPAWRLRAPKNAWVTGAPTSTPTHPRAPLPTHAQVVMDPVADLFGRLRAAGSCARAFTVAQR